MKKEILLTQVSNHFKHSITSLELPAIMCTSILTHDISVYVKSLYKENQNPALLYHNIEHTEKVVQRAHEIAANYSFNEIEIFILLAAAWFHDTGHLFGEARHHEERSAAIMQDYLKIKEVDHEIIAAIKGCILSTEIPQSPKTLLEKILCDADTFNLGTKEFSHTDSLLKKETELRNNIGVNNWRQSALDLLRKHTYFTPYCQALLNKGKQENIEKVRSAIQ